MTRTSIIPNTLAGVLAAADTDGGIRRYEQRLVLAGMARSYEAARQAWVAARILEREASEGRCARRAGSRSRRRRGSRS